MIFGTTFSQKYCGELGLDWKQVFTTLVTEINLKTIRLCAHWDLIEPEQDKFNFSDLEWQLDILAENKIYAVIAVGRKTPRWPEFHEPRWALLTDDFNHKRSLNYLEQTIQHFDQHPALTRWQIENEPFVAFGEQTYAITEQKLVEEIALAKKLSNKPIIVTDSAQWSSWRKAAKHADELGVNLYTITYKNGFYLKPPQPTWFYKFKINRLKKFRKKIFLAELQAEPWGPGLVRDQSEEEWNKSISPKRLESNINLARDSGFEEIWLWGAEWWIFSKERRNAPEMWDKVKELVKNSNQD